ncbi:DUF423 domain-containing protein [Vibrio sp. SM6]|uniref:DUF423 domain-containing protein n=1 Tax=Vibrio agarilyticus TaxID=2726741 RepID=A0A7X8TSS1_9VIBR|nr:DUF423 domain-containing protein [Vibrio agarilyticus]NLS14144.1 DUF423 domain-containing protein [Vibrio agarilyticus]
MRSQFLLMIAAMIGAKSVAIGAFAAHGLKSILGAYQLAIIDTGVQYQFWHTFAIIACAILMLQARAQGQKYFFIAAICFIIGIFCFSGSLYTLALTDIRWIAFITPVGGTLFVVGWIVFAVAAWKMREVSK